MQNHNIIMLNWNANGIKNHVNTLSAFLNHHNIDIACITETHLSNIDKIKFAGYNVYRADRNSPARSMGGIAILVRKNVKHHHIPIPDLQSLEAIGVLIHINNSSILIFSTYQPPSCIMHISDYERVMNLNNNVILAGDLNLKHTNWGCRVVNPNGNKLQKYISDTACTISAPSKPTYFPYDNYRLPDILNILLINQSHTIFYTGTSRRTRLGPQSGQNKYKLSTAILSSK